MAKRLREYGVFPNARWHVIQNIDNTPVEGFVKKSSGPFTFGFIGALTDEKGLGDLISAFASKGFESSELVIAGQGKDAYVSKMKSRVAMQPVRWLGQVSPNELYSAIDCLVVPSRWNEPLGLIVAEAQKRGIPIIASDRGGIPEILQDCPENMLFEPDSKGGLREAMLRMLSERPVGKPKSKEGELKFFESVEAIIKCI